MSIYDRQNEAWETNVGQMTVEEFLGGRADVEAAVSEYVKDIPVMFNDFDGDDEELAEIKALLIGYIEREMETA